MFTPEEFSDEHRAIARTAAQFFAGEVAPNIETIQHQGKFWPRVKYAVLGTCWVRRDNGQGKTLAVGRITGTFAAGQVSRLWMPARVATFGAGMQNFGGSVGLDVGINLFQEFWPSKK